MKILSPGAGLPFRHPISPSNPAPAPFLITAPYKAYKTDKLMESLRRSPPIKAAGRSPQQMRRVAETAYGRDIKRTRRKGPSGIPHASIRDSLSIAAFSKLP